MEVFRSSGPQLRIVILADSVLAQPTFETLLKGGWVAGLCTSHRSESGAKLRELARRTGISIFEATCSTLASGLVTWLRELRADILIAFTFPFRLPSEILRVAPLGAFNIHGGKLPEYRGPQPVFWEILNCEKEGAVTVHRMEEGLDCGAIIASQAIPIARDDTYGLHSVRIAFAAVSIVEFLLEALLRYGTNLPGLPQDEARSLYRRRPTADDMVIRWNEQSGDRIRGLIKAGNPWNQGAFTSIRGINLRLTDVTLKSELGSPTKPAGTIVMANAASGVLVNCRDGSALQVDVVSMDEGILPGHMLVNYGIESGEQFREPIRA
jgi:methionyl-tRNA formyltransferase